MNSRSKKNRDQRLINTQRFSEFCEPQKLIMVEEKVSGRGVWELGLELRSETGHGGSVG